MVPALFMSKLGRADACSISGLTSTGQAQKGLAVAVTLVCPVPLQTSVPYRSPESPAGLSALSRAAIGLLVGEQAVCSYLAPHGLEAASRSAFMAPCLSPMSGDEAFGLQHLPHDRFCEQPQLCTSGFRLNLLSEHLAPWPRSCGLHWTQYKAPVNIGCRDLGCPCQRGVIASYHRDTS